MAASLLVCAETLLSLFWLHSFRLTAFGDLVQCILLLSGLLSVLPNALQAKGRTRLFWALMTLGFGMWLWAQILWTYFEVFLRQDVPNPFVGDVILFLHIVPMMAAVAVQPHAQQDDRLARFGSLDFLLLLTWWLYLFLFVVIPWQYLSPNATVYGHSFDVLYLTEHVAFLLGLVLAWRQSTGSWRTVYAQIFGAALLYAIGSITASIAIDFHLYYTGSFYDVPLISAMVWFTGVGLIARRMFWGRQYTKTSSSGREIGVTRLAMLVVFSTPLMVAWAEFGGDAPQQVRTYRVLLTVGTMLVMGFLVFLRQHLLHGELVELLRVSHQNLEEMSRLKDDLENKENSLRWHSKELQRKNLELQEVSFTDALTGVWNRRYLEEILAADTNLALRSYWRARESAVDQADSHDLVFIMVDVDFFKQINDNHGHAAGDELLRKVAERLTTVLRSSDVLVRWGGEEFLVMSRSAKRSGAPTFCGRILDVMASEPFHLANGIKVRKTCSIGWAPYPWCDSAFETICPEEVIELADSALYRAKALGRNQSVGFLPSRGAIVSPNEINMESLRNEQSGLIEVVGTSSTSKDPLGSSGDLSYRL